MKELSEHEELIMRIFWRLEKALVREVLDELSEPKPPYTTLASTIRLLANKGYLSFRKYGTVYQYFPLVTQEEYSRKSVNNLVKNYFQGSVGNFLSFMVRDNKISDQEIDELQKLIENYEKGGEL